MWPNTCLVPRPFSVFHLGRSVSGHVFVSDTSPKRIHREGLAESFTGTRQATSFPRSSLFLEKGGREKTLGTRLLGKPNTSFPSRCVPHYESEAKCKTFHVKISFHMKKIFQHIYISIAHMPQIDIAILAVCSMFVP